MELKKNSINQTNKLKNIINNLTEKELIKANNKNPNVFSLINKPNYNIQKFAVKRWPYNIHQIKNACDELKSFAFKFDPYIKNEYGRFECRFSSMY